MKVTAILPDSLIHEVKELSGGKNITDSLRIALGDWINIQKIRKLNLTIEKSPLKFMGKDIAKKIRKLNRRRDHS